MTREASPLDDLKRLLEEATEGPWQTHDDYTFEGRVTVIGNIDGEYIDGAQHTTYDTVARCLSEYDDAPPEAPHNAALIVAIRNRIEALIKCAEAGQAVVSEAKSMAMTMRRRRIFEQLETALSDLEAASHA